MTLRVLSVASECVPLVKTGGLADVAGALPAALAPEDIDVATLLPAYPAVIDAAGDLKPSAELGVLFGGPARILRGQMGEHALFLLDAPHLFERPGKIYLGPDGEDWLDNPIRFAALSLAAARMAAQDVAGWAPQVLHLHDWQAGLTPIYLRQMGAADRIGTLMTIHNIAFQGLAPASLLDELSLPRANFNPQGYEFYGKISALKAGLVYADKISTVSPTYARELMTEQFGMGFDGVLRTRKADLSGILNGIDEEIWSPPYKTARGKAAHKKALRNHMGLPEAPGPLLVVVSRLTEQKGLDMLLAAMPAFLDAGGQVAVLGTGDPKLEAAFEDAAKRHDNVAAEITYNEDLARLLIMGGDVIAVPSRFEPCGLTQLYGLRFGTLPLVALTGGLADTVIPANVAARMAGVATGFQFYPVTARGLSDTLGQVVTAYKNTKLWAKMQKNAMRHPVGWSASAGAYGALLRSLVKTSA
ncbi:MAG: glycogen synthase GlgA [Pseudomonadota bacterium]